ncbi:hypothetical protein ACFSR7_15460 [Cohnella sp. GCM10020058]|uniref:hypothetical protein n=1 Tax=Cohnella sp. GCM10020058 TaxID=3317330 RepID=UPI00362C303B
MTGPEAGKKLTPEQRTQFIQRRMKHDLGYPETAAILCTTPADIASAEWGAPIPPELHAIIIQWIGEK